MARERGGPRQLRARRDRRAAEVPRGSVGQRAEEIALLESLDTGQPIRFMSGEEWNPLFFDNVNAAANHAPVVATYDL